MSVKMSVFRGSITEYPGVIVDHFVSSNCDRGRAFFLSHCHKGKEVYHHKEICYCCAGLVNRSHDRTQLPSTV